MSKGERGLGGGEGDERTNPIVSRGGDEALKEVWSLGK